MCAKLSLTSHTRFYEGWVRAPIILPVTAFSFIVLFYVVESLVQDSSVPLITKSTLCDSLCETFYSIEALSRSCSSLT